MPGKIDPHATGRKARGPRLVNISGVYAWIEPQPDSFKGNTHRELGDSFKIRASSGSTGRFLNYVPTVVDQPGNAAIISSGLVFGNHSINAKIASNQRATKRQLCPIIADFAGIPNGNRQSVLVPAPCCLPRPTPGNGMPSARME